MNVFIALKGSHFCFLFGRVSGNETILFGLIDIHRGLVDSALSETLKTLRISGISLCLYFFLTVEGAYSVLLGKLVGSLIRANTVIAKCRPLRTSHLLPDRVGAAHKYSRGCRFRCCIVGGEGWPG